MITLIKKTNINFVANRYIFFAISGLCLLAGMISVAVKGVNLGLDFTGGTLLQVKFEKPIEIGELRAAVKASGTDASLQSFTGRNSFALKVKGKQDNVNETADKLIQGMKTGLPGNTFIEERREYVGPVVGRDLSKKAVFAIVLSMFGIILYVAFRFSNIVWGVAGVIGLTLDVLVTFGALSITNREIDLVTVAALLTIAGYSINDTVVIFDRMRENMHNFPKMRLGELINVSVNETLSRTIITSLTVFSVVLVLYLFGGDVINNFAFAMLVGVTTGCYSTISIATPLVYQWEHKKNG